MQHYIAEVAFKPEGIEEIIQKGCWGNSLVI